MSGTPERSQDSPEPDSNAETIAPPSHPDTPTVAPPADDGTVSLPDPSGASAPTRPVAGRAEEWRAGDILEGRYEVKRIIGEGGMGRVYQVRHLGWQVDLAVKTLLPSRADSGHALERFLREAETWVDLGLHPAIAQCYYVREIDGFPRIFVEWVPGGTLRDWLRDDKLEPGDYLATIDVALQACHGLGYAHERGVVHRDIKPANCLMTRRGQLKVTDFGLAKSAGVDLEEAGPPPDLFGELTGLPTDLTVSGQLIGTPQYGAPEQWEDSRSVDARADIYSFGVMLFEMCCGRRPFRAQGSGSQGSAVRLIWQHMAQPAPDPRELCPDMPLPLRSLILACLEKDPDRRPQTMDDVLERLWRARKKITGEDRRSRPVTVGLPAATLSNRGASQFDLGKLEAARASWQEAQRLEPNHPEATYNELMLRWGQGELVDEEVVRRMREVQELHPDAARSAYLLGLVHLARGATAAARQAMGEESLAKALAMRRPEAFDAGEDAPPRCVRTERPHPGSGINAVSLSEDGERAISAGSDGALKLWDLASDTCLRTLEGHEGGISSLAARGRRVVTGSGDKTVRVWDLASGECTRRVAAGTSVYAVALSPDGQRILAGGLDNTVRLIGAESGMEQGAFRGGSQGVHTLAWLPDGSRFLAGSERLLLWRVGDEELHRAHDHPGGVFSLCVFPAGNRYASGGGDHAIRVWDAESGECTLVLEGHTGAVVSLSLDRNGRLLSGSRDRTLRLWDLASGTCLGTLEGHRGAVSGVALAQHGYRAISGGQDGTLRIWALDEAAVWQPALAPPRSVGDIVSRQRPFQKALAAARAALADKQASAAWSALEAARKVPGFARDPAVREVTAELAELLPPAGVRGAWPLRPLPGHTQAVRTILCPPDGRVLTGADDRSIRLGTLGDDGGDVTLGADGEGHGGPVTCLALNRSGQCCLSGSLDRTVRVWKLPGGELRHTLTAGGGVLALAFGSSGREVVAATDRSTISRWNRHDGARTHRLSCGETGVVDAAAFGLGGRLCLLGNRNPDLQLRLIDALTGECLRVLPTEANREAALNHLTFSSDGRTALSLDSAGRLSLWDLVDGARLRVMEVGASAGARGQVALSPWGRLALVSGDPLTMWDLASGEQVSRLEGAGDCLAFQPSGRHALVARGKTLRAWEFEWQLDPAGAVGLLESYGLQGGRRVLAQAYDLDAAARSAARPPKPPQPKPPSKGFLGRLGGWLGGGS